MAEKSFTKLQVQVGATGDVYTLAGGASGPNSIGSEEIKNDSVDMEDLTPAVREAIAAGGTPATDSDIDELFPDGGQDDDKEYADNSDIDELFP